MKRPTYAAIRKRITEARISALQDHAREDGWDAHYAELADQLAWSIGDDTISKRPTFLQIRGQVFDYRVRALRAYEADEVDTGWQYAAVAAALAWSIGDHFDYPPCPDLRPFAGHRPTVDECIEGSAYALFHQMD